MWLGPVALLTFAGAGVARAAEPAKAGAAKAEPAAEAAAEPPRAPECKSAGVTVTFVSGSTEIDQNGKGGLAGVATWLQNGEQRTVRLEGYSDKKGSAATNQRLSEERANAAKDYLLSRGIEPDRIMTFGHGEADDVALSGEKARVVLVTACDIPKAVAAETPAEPEAEAEPVAEAEPAGGPASEPEAKPAPVAPATVAAGPPPAPEPAAAPPKAKSDRPPSAVGIEASVGGGVIGFIDDAARSAAQTGGSWDARLMFGSRLPLAVEAAYVGSAQGIDALGLSTNSVLLGNGVEGTLRINLTRSRVQPYLFGGAGYTHYQLSNTATNTSSVLGSDDIGTIPMGAGVTGRIGRTFIVDARGTYRATFSDDLMRGIDTDNNSLQSWNTSGRVGFEF
jgi:outer membrane protein OmpA-like peptidoglycan-associated protein